MYLVLGFGLFISTTLPSWYPMHDALFSAAEWYCWVLGLFNRSSVSHSTFMLLFLLGMIAV